MGIHRTFCLTHWLRRSCRKVFSSAGFEGSWVLFLGFIEEDKGYGPTLFARVQSLSSVSCQGAVKTGPGIVHEGVSGARRGRSPITTQPTHVPDRRPDLMERNFRAKHPHQLWVADITYVRTRTRVCLHSVCHRCILTHDCGLVHLINHANRGIVIGSP